MDLDNSTPTTPTPTVGTVSSNSTKQDLNPSVTSPQPSAQDTVISTPAPFFDPSTQPQMQPMAQQVEEPITTPAPISTDQIPTEPISLQENMQQQPEQPTSISDVPTSIDTPAVPAVAVTPEPQPIYNSPAQPLSENEPAAPADFSAPSVNQAVDSAPTMNELEQAQEQQLNQPVQPILADQPPSQDQPVPVSDKKVLPKILLTAGPLFLVASLAISLVMTNNVSTQQAETYIQENIQDPDGPQWVEGLTNEEFLEYAPHNPESVQAFSDASQSAQLESGNSYNYTNPLFAWEPGYTVEPGADIAGYNVYFGTVEATNYLLEHPLYTREEYYFTDTTTFSPEDYGITLYPGNTYYLYIQSVSTGLADGGYDRQSMLPSKTYFIYKYE